MNRLTAVLLVLLFALSACGSPAAPSPEPSTTTALPDGTATPTEIRLPTATSTPQVTASPMCVNEACLADGLGLDFLIVTRPMFAEALQPYIDWKSRNGFRVGLVTVDWLDASYEGRHLAEKMKTGMHDLRRRAGLEYVLLVGDTVVYPSNNYETPVSNLLASYNLSNSHNVPTGFYRRLNQDPASVVLPSDAYFVEDRDWDPENTGLNPRPDDMETGEGTLNADLYLGRWPVQTLDQLDLIIRKTMAMVPIDSLLVAADESTSGTTICTEWPPTYGYHMQCFQNVILSWQEPISEDSGPYLTTERMLVDVNDSEQTTALMERILSSTDSMVLNFHGDLGCLGIQGSNCVPASSFQFHNDFPLLEISACVVGNFTHPARSFMESVLLAPKGPAIVTMSIVPVLFLQDLRAGISVGEAYWGTASVWIYWPNPILLLGDPSLPVFVPPGE